MYELVIVWECGDRDVYTYTTEAEAKEHGIGMRMAFGNQIAWWGTRKAK